MNEAINHAELAMLFRREFQLCNVNVQIGETIVLPSDLGARRDYVSTAFADLGTDVPICDCTVALDNDAIIDRGRFADEKMRVASVTV